MRNDLSGLVQHIGRMSVTVAILFIGVLAMFIMEAVFARRAEFDVRGREQHARFLARHDALTSLANRTLLAETMNKELGTARSEGGGFHLLALDLDGFKSVNDSYGHQTGDDLLKVIAERLTQIMRGRDMVARLGGDEFAIILTRLDDEVMISAIAQRIIDAIERLVILGGNAIPISTSIGIAAAPTDGDTDEAILRSADVAFYEAKAAGRRTFRLFKPAMIAPSSRALSTSPAALISKP